MKINREETIKILNLVKPGLANKAIIETNTHFAFTGQNIMTYNDRISIIHPFETNFKCTIPADSLYKVLLKIKDKMVEIKLEENELKIISSNIKSGLTINTDENINEIKVPNEGWKNLPMDFLDGIFLCMFAVSKDISHPLISNVSINGNIITATDDIRISKYEMKPPKMPNFLLPLTSAIELTKLNPNKFVLDESWVYFKDKNDIIFCSRIVKDEFPDMSGFFKIEGEEIKLPEDLIETIDSAGILAEGDIDIEKRISVKIGGKKISCQGKRDEGWIESQLTSNVKTDQDIKFTVNPIFLSQILSYSPTMIYSGDKVKFISDKFEHLLCLVID